MSSIRVVRHLNIYHEVESDFAIPKKLANEVFGAAADMVSRCVGRMTVSDSIGTRIPKTENPININRIRLAGKHVGLLTARGIYASVELSRDGRKATVAGIHAKVLEDNVVSESMFITNAPQRGVANPYARLLDTSVHEIAHTWGAAHCPDETCVMTACDTPTTDLTQRLGAGSPFCDDCSENLEIAGYQALAAQLG